MHYGWQLNPSHWSRFAGLCATRRWQRTYLEDTYRHRIPTTSGIYLICASFHDALPPPTVSDRLYTRLYTAIYVGQAKNLRRRFADHTRGYGRVNKAHRVFRRFDYWYTKVSEMELDDVEQCFLDVIGPVANDRNVLARIGTPVPAGRLANRNRKD